MPGPGHDGSDRRRDDLRHRVSRPPAGCPDAAAAMTAGRTVETAPAEADPVEAARAENALAIVRSLARTQHLPAELNAVLDGPLAGAVSVAADYASGAISEATRAAYRGDWTEFAAWRRTQHVDPTALPIHPVLVAAYLAGMAGKIGRSALRRDTCRRPGTGAGTRARIIAVRVGAVVSAPDYPVAG